MRGFTQDFSWGIAFGPSGGGGGGGGGQNTVTQVQQIPQFEQDFAQANQNLARSLGSQNFPMYQGQLVAGQTPLQSAGQAMAGSAAGVYQPFLDEAHSGTLSAINGALQPTNLGDSVVRLANAQQGRGLQQMNLDPSNAATVKQFMSPYVEAALAPQVQDLNLQLAQQQKAIDSQATQAGAFGDARQGAQAALQNLYGNQAMNQLLGAGYNTAFGNAMNAIQNQQALGNQNISQSIGAIQGQQGVQQNQIGLGLNSANQLANLGQMAQGMGITGANALYNAGAQQQGLQQQQLNAAYQQFLNQVNWPYQMLNVQESALSNSPYNISSSVTLPNANPAASTLGTFANVAGSLGSLFGGGSNAPFGGSAYH